MLENDCDEMNVLNCRVGCRRIEIDHVLPRLPPLTMAQLRQAVLPIKDR
jgi:hypothetical protein